MPVVVMAMTVTTPVIMVPIGLIPASGEHL
jgi:hypothetical protein